MSASRAILLCIVSLTASLHAGSDLSWNTIDGGGATFSSGGTFVLGGTIGQPDASGALSGGTRTFVGGFWATMNHPQIALTSGPTPSPAQGTVGVPIVFTTASNAVAANFVWNWGDGLPDGAGAPVQHTFFAPGTYTVAVTGTDLNTGQTASGSVLVLIVPVNDSNGDPDGDGDPNNSDTDDDNDGFPDDIETVAGTDPTNGTSTPTGGPGGVPQLLNISKLGIKLNFARQNSDSLSVSGTQAIPDTFAVNGQKVVVDVGGAGRSFTLDGKGKSPKGNDAYKISIKAKKGVVAAQQSKYSVKFGKATFSGQFANEGLVSADLKNVSTPVVVTVVFGTGLFQKTQPQTYSAKAGKSGSTKTPK